MNCPLLSEHTNEILLDYPAGRLDPYRAATLEKHMLVCARCAAFQADHAEVWKALDAWEPMPVSIGFNRRIWLRIDEAARAPWYRKLADSLRMGAWKPAFPLAMAVCVIAAGFLFDHQGLEQNGVRKTDAGGAVTSRVSITEVDQVERTLDDIQLLRQFDAASSSRPASSQPM